MIRSSLILVLIGAFVLAAGPSFGQKKKEKKKKKKDETVEVVAAPIPKDTLMTEMDSISYAIGVYAATHFGGRGIRSLNYELLGKGFGDQFEFDKAKMESDFARQYVEAYLDRESKRMKDGNLKAGEEFLRKNRLRPDVKNFVSGLQYRIITETEGPKPGLRNVVTCHYTGRKLDGTVFESSYEKGEPMQFPVNGVITGWTEALRQMSVGSKWELFIPANMAYGERGSLPDIEPNEALIFEVELLSIDKQ